MSVREARRGAACAVLASPLGVLVVGAAGVPLIFRDREMKAGYAVGPVELKTDLVCVIERHTKRIDALLAPRFPLPGGRRRGGVFDPVVRRRQAEPSWIIHAAPMLPSQ